MRVASSGPPGGPLLLLVHGWPECWYSWRRQIPFLAQAGYRVLAPDLRGFGGSEAPRQVDAYRIDRLVDDMKWIVRAEGRDQAIIIGHDWGAVVAWHAALLDPEMFYAVAALSVPYLGLPPAPPTKIWRHRYGDRFYYILYHQEPGVAEAEYAANPEGLLRMLLAAPDTPRAAPDISDPNASAGGFIGRWGRPLQSPPWLSDSELDYYLEQYHNSGFHGGLNLYRNFDANWQFMENKPQRIDVPALYIVGSRDLVVQRRSRSELESRLSAMVPQLESFEWIDGAGHWIQQEKSKQCNRTLLQFIEKQVK